MKNVITRSISGIVYIVVIVGAILLGELPFYLLTTLFAVIGIYEFDKISHNTDDRDNMQWVDYLFAGCITFSTYFQHTLHAPVFILGIYMLARCTLSLRPQSAGAFVRLAKSVLGVVYISVPLYLLNLLYSCPGGPTLVLLMFIMIWLNDTGAFCFGSTLGRRKLCERLSPKKSWEGFWGGMLCCIVFGWACYEWFNTVNYNLVLWLVLGAMISVFSTWGDLFESMLKRTFGVKDSGNIIPGHGGILDRIDSLLFVSTATSLFYWAVASIL